MLDFEYVSATRIKTFKDCLFKYYINYYTDLPQKSNFGATHGSLIHHLLEQYVKQQDFDWYPELLKGYRGEIEDLEPILPYAKDRDLRKPNCLECPFASDSTCTISGEQLSQLSSCPKYLFNNSVNMMNDVLKRYKKVYSDKSKIIDPEFEFQLDIGGQRPIKGIMDLVFERDEETIVIVDYKSGKWTQDFEACKEDIQCRMYSLAARKIFIEDILGKGYKYKYSYLIFDYFVDHPVIICYSKDEDLDTQKDVKLIINEMLALEPKDITRCIGNRDFNWRCRSLCDPNTCAKEWPRFVKNRNRCEK